MKMHLNTHLSIIYNMLTKIIIKTVIIVCNVLDTTRMLVLNTGNSYTVCTLRQPVSIKVSISPSFQFKDDSHNSTTSYVTCK